MPFQELSHRRDRWVRGDNFEVSFSAFSVNSAVNCKFLFLIKLYSNSDSRNSWEFGLKFLEEEVEVEEGGVISLLLSLPALLKTIPLVTEK